MALYRAGQLVPGHAVVLRPDGTYTLQEAKRDAAQIAVARVALRELAERRARDVVARRLLSEAGVIQG